MSTGGTIHMEFQPDQLQADVSITICVPVYNVEKYLRECLDSIFMQDYSNFDVVMVDDGSTDSSRVICDEYVTRYRQRACVVHKNNEGPLLARRDAFARAQGDYIMCIDSDDMLLPGALILVANTIAVTNADVVRFGYTRDFDTENVFHHQDVKFELRSREQKATVLQSLCCDIDGSLNPMCFKAIRRSCIGLDFDFSEFRNLTYAEDFIQTVVVYDRAESFCFLDVPIYFYRPGSGISGSYKPHFHRDNCRSFDFAERFARSWEVAYDCDGLLDGLAARRLNSAGLHAEHQAHCLDFAGLDTLRSSLGYIDHLKDLSTYGLLRFNRRLVIWALRHHFYIFISVLGCIKSSLKRSAFF